MLADSPIHGRALLLAHRAGRNSEQCLVHPICLCVHVHIYVCMCRYTYVYICMCLYICIYLHVYRECLSGHTFPPSLLLMAPNQAAADLTNLFGTARASVAAQAVWSSALTQGGSCTLSRHLGACLVQEQQGLMWARNVGPEPPGTSSVSEWPCPGPTAAQQLAASCLAGQESSHPDARGRRATKKQLLILQPWKVSAKLRPEHGNE